LDAECKRDNVIQTLVNECAKDAAVRRTAGRRECQAAALIYANALYFIESEHGQ
jgi:hypothetical protein